MFVIDERALAVGVRFTAAIRDELWSAPDGVASASS
jgi:hypothetical protein